MHGNHASTHRSLAVALALWVALALLMAPTLALAAEMGWVRGAPLNLRSGAGTQYRITGTVAPGEGLDILERAEKWTRIRTAEGKEGWISAGYLDAQAPPAKRLAQIEAELARTRARLETTGKEAEQLRQRGDALSGADEEQRETIERLTKENDKLRVGERWLEWITGALILSLGMAGGALLSRLGGRRNQRRLRL